MADDPASRGIGRGRAGLDTKRLCQRPPNTAVVPVCIVPISAR